MTTASPSTPRVSKFQEDIHFTVCPGCGQCAVRREYKALDVPPVVTGYRREDIAETVKAHPLDIPLLIVGVMCIAAIAAMVNHAMRSEWAQVCLLAAWTVADFTLGFIVARALSTCERPPSAGENPPGEA